MFRNLPLKILSLVLATVFWIFIVSLESNFVQFPEQIPIQVFNLAPDLALTGQLGTVKLGLRAADAGAMRSLSANDFEAYVDLRNAGAGTRKVQIAVTSKNSQVIVAKIDPAEAEVELQPVRKKMVTLTADVQGKPAKGYSLDSVKLKQSLVTVSGAETFLKKIASARAQVVFQGNEKKNMTKKVQVVFYDENDLVLEGLKVEDKDLEADVLITEVEGTKEVGVKASVEGAVVNGTVKKVEVNPAVVTITGSSENLGKLEILETAPIDLKGAAESFEVKVKLILPSGVTLVPGQADEVSVKVEIEKP